MVRRKEFSLKFTDSLLLSADSGFPDGIPASSTIADDIFNDPDAWSDASLDSGDEGIVEGKQLVPQNVGAVRRSRAAFPVKARQKLRRRASISSPPSAGWEKDALSPIIQIVEPEHAKGRKDLTLDLDLARMSKRMSIVFSGSIFHSLPSESSSSPSSASSTGSKSATPLTVTTNLTVPSPATAGTSPIVVSASATWSFLEWYGVPETPKIPRTAGAALSNAAGAPDWSKLPPVPRLINGQAVPATAAKSPRKSALLMVPKVPPTPTRFVQRRNRPLPTVPSPLPHQAPQPSPLQITSPPPPPPPRGGRARSPAPPSLTVVAAPPAYGSEDPVTVQRKWTPAPISALCVTKSKPTATAAKTASLAA